MAREMTDLSPNILSAEAVTTEMHDIDADFLSADDAFSSVLSSRQDMNKQTSLRTAISCAGIGLHSGKLVTMRVEPAPADTGILFIRTDAAAIAHTPALEGRLIPARFTHVSDVMLCTKITNKNGFDVGTIEHLLAAFSAMNIDNAYIKLDAAEVPIMDGSADYFITMIKKAGIATLSAPRSFLHITRPVRVERDDAYCELVPADNRIFEASIDFSSKAIGRQSFALNLDAQSFVDEIARARTFCMLKDVEAMDRAGLGKGGSLDNTIVVDDDHVVNQEGLRNQDEFVRHKVLDAIGDLYLAGMPIIGRYRGYKSGHALHHALLTALFENPDAFEIVTGDYLLLAAE